MTPRKNRICITRSTLVPARRLERPCIDAALLRARSAIRRHLPTDPLCAERGSPRGLVPCAVERSMEGAALRFDGLGGSSLKGTRPLPRMTRCLPLGPSETRGGAGWGASCESDIQWPGGEWGRPGCNPFRDRVV
eukprot:scaffold139_cov325-Pavlova_lutheri.AAC.54